MARRTKVLIAGAAAAVAALGVGVGVAAAGSNGDDHEPAISGTALDRASAAALDATGGGRVTETEVGDEDSYYEVEVTLDDGSQVDVQLDKSFHVVDQMPDHEERGQSDNG
jgi:uncharacterized membrane protein YkoI